MLHYYNFFLERIFYKLSNEVLTRRGVHTSSPYPQDRSLKFYGVLCSRLYILVQRNGKEQSEPGKIELRKKYKKTEDMFMWFNLKGGENGILWGNIVSMKGRIDWMTHRLVGCSRAESIIRWRELVGNAPDWLLEDFGLLVR